MQIFNNRELAVIIWVTILFVAALFNTSIRKSFKGLLDAMFHKKILFAFLGMSLYIALIIYLLYLARLWNVSLIGDLVWWLFGTGLVLFFNIHKATEEEGFFQKTAREVLTVTFILGFITDLYVFNIWVELTLVPLFLFMGALVGVAATDDKYKSVVV